MSSCPNFELVRLSTYEYKQCAKSRLKVKMVHYENHAFYLHEKSYTKGYSFMRITYDDRHKPVYRIDWKDLVAILESHVIKELKLN